MCKGSMTAEPACDHLGGAWTPNGDGTHTSTCKCGENVTDGPCHDLGSGKCYMCGYEFPVEEPECSHEWKGVKYKDEATHTIVCRDCLEPQGEEEHTYVNNMPCACGAIEPYAPECQHEWKGVTYRDETTHTVVCRDCLEPLSIETHRYENNMPCACGANSLKHEHDWYEAHVVEANCKRAGKITWKCNGCDESYIQKVAKDSDNHTKLVCVRTVKAKCERGGCEVWYCRGCNQCVVKETEATGHNYKVTKKTSRYVMYTCKSCGDSYTEMKTPETGNDRPANNGQNQHLFPFHKFFPFYNWFCK